MVRVHDTETFSQHRASQFVNMRISASSKNMMCTEKEDFVIFAIIIGYDLSKDNLLIKITCSCCECRYWSEEVEVIANFFRPSK